VWCSPPQNLELNYAFNPSAEPLVPGCNQVWFASALRQSIVFALLTIGFHMLCYFSHQPMSIIGKLYGARRLGRF